MDYFRGEQICQRSIDTVPPYEDSNSQGAAEFRSGWNHDTHRRIIMTANWGAPLAPNESIQRSEPSIDCRRRIEITLSSGRPHNSEIVQDADLTGSHNLPNPELETPNLAQGRRAPLNLNRGSASSAVQLIFGAAQTEPIVGGHDYGAQHLVRPHTRAKERTMSDIAGLRVERVAVVNKRSRQYREFVT